jgi:MYXO-CTERM domain-containing protein
MTQETRRQFGALAGALAVMLAGCQDATVPAQASRRALESAARAVVPLGATWEYHDEGGDPGAGWQSPGAADLDWKVGLAPFGYGQGDEATGVGPAAPAAKPLTLYYRIRFEVPDPARVLALRVRLLHDDGAVAYLNGREIYRRNLPAGAIAPATLATSAAAPAFAEQALEMTSLQRGTNVLAVEVHQDAPDSPAHRFDLALEATETVAVTRGPYLQSATPTQVTVRWRMSPPFAGRLSYGTSPGALTTILDSPSAAGDHAVTITGLAPGTRYHYAVGTPGQALAGGDAGFSFVTPPAPGAAAATRLWILGDAGTGNADAARVRDAYRAFTGTRPTDVWLMLGDNAYPRGTDGEYQEALFDFFPELLRSHSLWPTLGNADVLCCEGRPETSPYLDVFTLPTQGEAGGVPSGTELYYSFDHGNIHVVMLDSTLSDRTAAGPMLRWLRRDLEANTRTWLIAVWHHPPYTRGEHDSDSEAAHVRMRENAVPILEEYGVDLVLGGHSHNYERSMLIHGHHGFSTTLTAGMKKDPGTGRPEETGPYRKAPGPNGGAVYVVLGSSGQLTPGPLDHPAMVVSSLALGSLVVDVQGNELEATFLRDTGEIGDHFTIVKGASGGGGGCAVAAGGAGSPVVLALLGMALVRRLRRRRR